MKKIAAIAAFLALFPALALAERIEWAGRVEISGKKVLPRGAELVLAPGTTVVFKRIDTDGDGWGDSSIVIEEGALTARGTVEMPILFTSEGPAAPGEWGEIRLDFSKVDVSRTVIEGSTRGLHMHFCSGAVADSALRLNVDATRLGESKIEFTRCLFSQNASKGFNARASTNSVRDSWFRGNKRAIFLFEGDRDSLFTGNLFTSNETPVRLGDFFEGTVKMTGNRWDGGEAPPPDGPAGYLSDPGQNARLEWKDGKAGSAGPSGWPLFRPEWERKMTGFVDADPVASELGAYAADWSGAILRLGLFDGAPLSSHEAGDVIDSRPALGEVGGKRLLAAQTWGRKIILLDAVTLEKLDEFTEEPSPADDHRQSAPLFEGDRLYAGTWAGKVRAFDTSAGKLKPLWALDAENPIRAPLVSAGKFILAATEGGKLLALGRDGAQAWKAEFGSSLLSAPLAVGEKIYVGDKGGKLTALSAADGKPLWSAPLCGAAWYSPPAFGGGKVFQGDDGGCVSGFDGSNGALLWRIKVDGGVRSAPFVEGGRVLLTTLGGSLCMLDAATGFALDRLQYAQPIGSAPFMLGGRVYLGGRDGKMRAVEIVSQP